jgi:hypothetical protein
MMRRSGERPEAPTLDGCPDTKKTSVLRPWSYIMFCQDVRNRALTN